MDQCKGVDGLGSLLHVHLPDIQNAICEEFHSVECSVEASPELTEPPFNFAFHALGKKIHLLPSGSVIPKDFYQVSVVSEGVVVTDGLASEYLHLVLEGGDDWRTPLQKVFNEKLGINWCFLVMELQSGAAHFHVLHAQMKPIKSYAECTILWLSELKQAPTLQPLLKPKTNKKIVKKLSMDTEANGKITVMRTTKNSNGQKTVRKKIVAISSTTIPTAVGVPNDDTKSENIPVNNKKTVVSKGRNSLMNGMDGENYINGDGSADSGISLLDSDTEKSSKCMKSHELSEHEPIPSTVKQIEIVNGSEFVIPRAIPITTSKTNLETTNKDNISTVPESFTMRRNSIKYEIHKKVERILEEEEKEKSEDWDKSASELISNQNMANHCLNGRDISGEIRMKRPMPVHISSIFPKNFLSNGPNSLQRLSSRDDILLTRRLVDEEMPPVQVLQLVLKKFSYKELGELRQVHPHWDELCGQALNSGYHELIKKADKLLTDCQRHVHSEPDLHDVLSVLTNVQVHILNPVDILRPAMDEGVCCFPYGELLDQTFYIIEKAKEIMEGRKDIIIKWKPVAELARRAQLHYKSNLKALMEEKLGEVIRLKALQSIQRIDSFMIDSTVNKLEKATHMARDELEWEIEQLRHQNAQLKKDNRELRKDCMRLEARVEIIENKFKTMARLLQ
ncbi:F-box only protein [Dirofilaria immitis]